ncbi:MAG: hypothetical protein LQ347_006588 [Umbilicaria vellea]|nr:MAG: hypothetical protein LQ347_006588 [Umbilicaria vellea]
MAPPPPRHAPTTLKQAKKAYKKASAIPRLSEAELARIQRLQEREEKHERMRERERKRLLNRKKRDEKIAKEKELRKKMGLPEPGAPYVGPSQVRISQFVTGGKVVTFKQVDGHDEEQQDDEYDEEMLLSELDEKVLAALESPVSEKAKTPRKPLERLDGNRTLSQDSRGRHSSPETMVADDCWASMFVSNTQIQRELSTDADDDEEAEAVQEDVPKSAQGTAVSRIPPVAKAADDTADLLALISTQDLEDAEDFDKSVISASTQYPDFTEESQELSMSQRLTPAFTNDPDFTEEELRELQRAIEAEERPASATTLDPDFTEDGLRKLESSVSSALTGPVHTVPHRAAVTPRTTAPGTDRGGSHVDPEITSFDIDDFELSTQDLRELDA